MQQKTLRIIFSGISTLTPGPPENGDEPPDKAFVMMATNVDKSPTIPDHFPFVHVAASLLVDPPQPAETVFAGEGSEHFIYYFHDARVLIDPPPKPGTGIDYYIDPEKRPLAERPGSDDVAPANDIRWLADSRDLFSQPAPLKKTADPTASNIGNEVAAVVNLDGGRLKANFSCASALPKTFMDPKTKTVVPDFRRVLAGEFKIDIPYAQETDRITLSFQKLREGTPVSGPEKLVLSWPEEATRLVIRMGHDAKSEVRLLDTPEHCDPVRLAGPVLKPRDEEFDLHFNLLDIPPGAGRPIPQDDIHQCGVEDCKPFLVRRTGGGGK